MWIMRTSCVQRLQQFSHSEGHTQLTDWRRSNPIQSKPDVSIWICEYLSEWANEYMSMQMGLRLRLQAKEKRKTENGKPWIRGSMIYVLQLLDRISPIERFNSQLSSKRSETWTIATPPSSHGDLHKKPHKHHVSNINGVPRSGLPYQLLLLLLLLPLLLLHCTPNWSSKLQFNPFTTALSGCAINLYWAQNVREIRKAKTE